MSFEWLKNCEPCLTPRRNYSTQHKLLKRKYRETKLKSTRKRIFLALKDIYQLLLDALNFNFLHSISLCCTDLGLIDMLLTNQNAEIVACILLTHKQQKRVCDFFFRIIFSLRAIFVRTLHIFLILFRKCSVTFH